jgi:hypothetical protein
MKTWIFRRHTYLKNGTNKHIKQKYSAFESRHWEQLKVISAQVQNRVMDSFLLQHCLHFFIHERFEVLSFLQQQFLIEHTELMLTRTFDCAWFASSWTTGVCHGYRSPAVVTIFIYGTEKLIAWVVYLYQARLGMEMCINKCQAWICMCISWG